MQHRMEEDDINGCFFGLVWFFSMYVRILAVPGLSCDVQTLSGGMRDIVPQPGIEPGPRALGAQSLTH